MALPDKGGAFFAVITEHFQQNKAAATNVPYLSCIQCNDLECDFHRLAIRMGVNHENYCE